MFAVGLCANVLIGLPAMPQAPAEVTLTRIECGTGATPTDVMVHHRANQDYDMPQRRLMHRTTMGGAVPAEQPRRRDQAAWRLA